MPFVLLNRALPSLFLLRMRMRMRERECVCMCARVRACTLCVHHTLAVASQVFIGSALGSGNAGVEAIKAWAISKLPEGPTLYPKVRLCRRM